jgi:hypothetical protein
MAEAAANSQLQSKSVTTTSSLAVSSTAQESRRPLRL